MSFNRSRCWVALAAIALGSTSSMLFAQPGAFGGGYGPPLRVVAPPRAFATSDDHYKYLLAQAKGGTKHTIASVPRWDGVKRPRAPLQGARRRMERVGHAPGTRGFAHPLIP